MKDLRHHYRDYYRGPDAWREMGAEAKARNIREIWRKATGKQRVSRIADVGCGEGAVAQVLAAHNFFDHLHGFDISSSGVSAAQSRSIERADFSEYDGKTLPVSPGEYELVVLSHVLEHVEEPRTVLKEAARVGIWVLVEVPYELHARTPPNFEWTDTGHINLFNDLTLRHLVQSTGLVVAAEMTTGRSLASHRFLDGKAKGAIKWLITRSMLRVSPWIASRLFTYHGTVLARNTSHS